MENLMTTRITALVGGLALVSSAYKLYQTVLPTHPNVLSAGKLMYEGVKQLYDRSSSIWISTWGDHMHSGYYHLDKDVSQFKKSDHLQAQHEMMEQLLNILPFKKTGSSNKQMGEVFTGDTIRVLDCGCGVGGSSRFLFNKFVKELEKSFKFVQVVGITLSPYQQRKATKITSEAGFKILSPQDVNIWNPSISGLVFMVKNALDTKLPSESFDLVWTLESGEHMPNKKVWLTEMHRILKPGGFFLCACWCHRELEVASKAFQIKSNVLTEEEKILLGRISKNYSLPRFVSPSAYKLAGEQLSMKGFDESITSFTQNVMPFWPAVVKSSLKPLVLLKLFFQLPFVGLTVIKGAVTAYLMNKGFVTGTLEFPAFALQKSK